ncbi:hypothetical protein FRX31_005295 [Thalictrum thalictroides]|uniref:Uncharacterized protein n=1 Tax=Thalictrum thalictroides TaxID=46969 RepID=A0A7J6X7W2_THATH|nr:hypothetical protein FRX31_005295 [Thalictrum thalictroides]
MGVVMETETCDDVQPEDALMLTNGNTNKEIIMPVDPRGAPVIVSPRVIQKVITIKARFVELVTNRQGIMSARETKKFLAKGKKAQNKEIKKDLGPPTTRLKAK